MWVLHHHTLSSAPQMREKKHLCQGLTRDAEAEGTTDIVINIHTHIGTDRQTDSYIDGWMNREIDRWINPSQGTVQ